MAAFLPAPDPADRTSGAGKRSRGRSRGNIPSVDEVLEMLMRLNGLVALKMLSTAQAAVIQRSLRTILDAQLKRTQGGQDVLPHDVLAEIYRRDPRAAELLEPFLTEEQVQWLMGGGTEGADGDV